MKLSKSVASAGAVVAALSILVAGASGCGASCDVSDNTPEVFTGGVANAGEYASSSRLGPFLHFPGGKEYQLVHHLGFAPNIVNIDLAFTADDERMAASAGNSTEKRCVDEHIIWVKNDTCTEFWILVTASGRSPTPVARCNGDNVELDVDAGVVADEATTGESGTDESAGDGEAPDAGGPDI